MKDTDKVMQKKFILAVATHTFLNISVNLCHTEQGLKSDQKKAAV